MANVLLNIANADEMASWIKSMTWGNTDTIIRRPDISNPEFVSKNTDAVACMMVHSYTKKHLNNYMESFLGTPALQQITDMSILSDAARAAVAAGYPAYKFNANALPPELIRTVSKLSDFLRASAIEYLKECGCAPDIRWLDTKYPNIMSAIKQSKFPKEISLKTPPQASKGILHEHDYD